MIQRREMLKKKERKTRENKFSTSSFVVTKRGKIQLQDSIRFLKLQISLKVEEKTDFLYSLCKNVLHAPFYKNADKFSQSVEISGSSHGKSYIFCRALLQNARGISLNFD